MTHAKEASAEEIRVRLQANVTEARHAMRNAEARFETACRALDDHEKSMGLPSIYAGASV